jgi:hypothetical protein
VARSRKPLTYSQAQARKACAVPGISQNAKRDVGQIAIKGATFSNPKLMGSRHIGLLPRSHHSAPLSAIQSATCCHAAVSPLAFSPLLKATAR